MRSVGLVRGRGPKFEIGRGGVDRPAGELPGVSGCGNHNYRSLGGDVTQDYRKLTACKLQEQDSARNIARIYRVYGMTSLLTRWRKNGHEYVVRHKGVDFVFPDVITSSGGGASPGDVSPTNNPRDPGDAPPPGAPPSWQPVDVTSSKPGDASSPLLRTNLQVPLRTSSTSTAAVSAAATILREELGIVDNDAATRIRA